MPIPKSDIRAGPGEHKDVIPVTGFDKSYHDQPLEPENLPRTVYELPFNIGQKREALDKAKREGFTAFLKGKIRRENLKVDKDLAYKFGKNRDLVSMKTSFCNRTALTPPRFS